MPFDRVKRYYYLLGHPGMLEGASRTPAEVAYNGEEYSWMEAVSRGKVERFPWDALVSMARVVLA